MTRLFVCSKRESINVLERRYDLREDKVIGPTHSHGKGRALVLSNFVFYVTM